jgi:DNA-binding LytR/AlgR family response regulator
MNCIVIDDEPLARAGMEMQIKKIPSLHLLGTFSNPLDATQILQKGEVDLLFLDINMPEMNGLDFMKTLVQSPMVIFATAYPQYALDSFEFNTIDYLLKPIRFERFVKAVNKAQSYKAIFQSKETLETKIEAVNDDFIFIKADRKFFKIFFKDISYIEGLKDYVIIHTPEKKVVTAMNLKTIFEQLPPKIFARISKFYIVNMEHIVAFDTFNVFLANAELAIGLAYKDDFFNGFAGGEKFK